MFRQSGMEKLAAKRCFNFEDFSAALQDSLAPLGEASMRKLLQKMLKSGEIIRTGRNAYYVPQSPMAIYQHEYSNLSNQVAKTMQDHYALLPFSIFELIQLNEFVNHQLAHNGVFLSVEEDVMEFVFDTMKEAYPGKVLFDPTLELYHQYWYDGIIVINKLVTEAPQDPLVPWHTRLEKLLVDLFCEKILMESISESEFPTLLEDAFSRYVIDESCLFRYAKRRGADKRLKKLISEQTEIVLRTE